MSARLLELGDAQDDDVLPVDGRQSSSLMKTLLVLVDFSEVSAKALEHAKRMALVFRSHLVLLHVASPGMDAGGTGMMVKHDPSTTSAAALRARLFELKDELVQSGINATAEQAHGILIAEHVAREVARGQVDLVIMGAHQHGALYHMVAGSIPPKVLSKLRCPVLVVPA